MSSNDNPNYYSALGDDMEEDASSNHSAEEVAPKKPYIPPVVINKLPYDKVLSILSSVKIFSYKIKHMSIGTKVFLETCDDREMFIRALKTKKFEFFSYSNRETRPIKYILSGLNSYSTSDVFDELLSKNISCADVKQINVKNKRYDTQTNYLVSFKKGTINFNELQKCKALFNTIVSWSYWRKKPNSVTQCYRCQMFGHLTANCQNVGRAI